MVGVDVGVVVVVSVVVAVVVVVSEVVCVVVAEVVTVVRSQLLKVPTKCESKAFPNASSTTAHSSGATFKMPPRLHWMLDVCTPTVYSAIALVSDAAVTSQSLASLKTVYSGAAGAEMHSTAVSDPSAPHESTNDFKVDCCSVHVAASVTPKYMRSLYGMHANFE